MTANAHINNLRGGSLTNTSFSEKQLTTQRTLDHIRTASVGMLSIFLPIASSTPEKTPRI